METNYWSCFHFYNPVAFILFVSNLLTCVCRHVDVAIIQDEDENTEAMEDIILKKEEEEEEDPAGAMTLTVEEGASGDIGVETVELSVSEETAAAAANGDLTPEMILSMMDR